MQEVKTQNGTIYKEVTLTLDTNQYAGNDVLADTQEVADVFPQNTVGTWQSLTVLDKDDQGVAIDVILLKTEVSIGTENSAVSITDANADEILCSINVATGDYVDMIGCQFANKAKIGHVVTTDTTSNSLWVAAVTRGGTPTYTASGITIKLGFTVDEVPG